MQASLSRTEPSTGAPRALLVGGTEDELRALEAHVARCGLRPERAPDCRHALRGALPDVALVAASLPDGNGPELIGELRRRCPGLGVLAFASEPTYDQLRASLAAGARDLLRPGAAPSEWDAALVPAALPAAPDSSARLQLDVPTTEAGLDRALLELLAFATRAHHPPTTRARLATAAAELLDNVRRHAGGSARLTARNLPTHLELEIADSGPGFDAPQALLQAEGASPSGLARAHALVERFTVHSDDRGTTVRLEVDRLPGSFADVDDLDLTDRDYLDPATARALVAPAGDSAGPPPAPHLSPALSVVLGRLLSPRTQDALVRACLWSRAS